MDLHCGYSIKYNDKLIIAFKEQEVNGQNVYYFGKQELRGFGVDSFVDRGAIFQHIQELVNQNQNDGNLINAYQQKEGQDGTNYM